ncbi:Copia protein AltName: Full=Gag-int-pol protein [Rhizoctonia solani AG-1 IB]|uniref:Rhizoctonia solani AG1-IB WGS project CAOJ00000000 data, isolate 7/3/14, contig 23555 n=1 Tax=Thanatephorus cucumeris (strain AG1-IB / isolate 7/3/14) TaxID=1108050 RepID=M5CH45_THACB|nr:Copia protein AltName: Full=Gag-int-pol protein [Rhizoctonia solani AG-1 IB]
MEAEFIATCTTVKEVLSIRQFLDDLGVTYNSNTATPILCDNQAAIEAIHNPTHKTRAKHIDIAYNFICDEVQNGHIAVSFIPTCKNLADALTKPLNYNQHWYLSNSFLAIHKQHHSNILGNFFPRALLALDQSEYASSLPEAELLA